MVYNVTSSLYELSKCKFTTTSHPAADVYEFLFCATRTRAHVDVLRKAQILKSRSIEERSIGNL